VGRWVCGSWMRLEIDNISLGEWDEADISVAAGCSCGPVEVDERTRAALSLGRFGFGIEVGYCVSNMLAEALEGDAFACVSLTNQL